MLKRSPMYPRTVTRPKASAVTLAVLLATFSTGCATTQGRGNVIKDTFANDDPCANSSRNSGMLFGVIAGGLLQMAMQDKRHNGVPAAGMLVGGAIGAFIGHDMDRRRCELAKVARAHNLDVVMADIHLRPVMLQETRRSNQALPTPPAKDSEKSEPVGMSVAVIDHGSQFVTGSAIPSEETVKAFAAIADKYKITTAANSQDSTTVAQMRGQQMRLLFVGHTDDTGPSQLNADLSEARARAIAQIFAQHGFTADQIFYQGAGEVFPTADNRTEEGRAKNRRVEIIDLSDDAAFAAFLASRKPNLANYRLTPTAKPTVAAASQLRSSLSARTSTAKVDTDQAKASMAIADAPRNAATATKTTKVAENTSRLRKGMAPTPLDDIDLGGNLVNGHYHSIDIGKTAKSGLFSIISTAYAADEAPLGSCAKDHPRISHGVKSLSTDKTITYKTSDYLPGAASSSWAGKVNGHLVGLTHVAVLRDGGQPAARPDVFIYMNYVEGSRAKPDLSTSAEVNAYQGDKAMLYRAFITQGPMRCVDMVIPNTAPNMAPTSNIIYTRRGELYQTSYSPTIVR